MRKAIAVGLMAILLSAPKVFAADPPLRQLDGRGPSPSQMAPRPWHDAGADGYRVIAIAVGAVVGVIAANFLSGGMITPLLTLGAAGPSTGALTAGVTAAPSVSGIGLGAGSLLVAAPAAMASMGMMTPLLGTAAPTAAAAATAASATAGAAGVSSVGGAGLGMGLGMGAEMSVMVAAPTALRSIGAPVDAALRDGYTTPTVLVAAFEESAYRAGNMILQAGAYIGSAANSWLTGQ